MGAGAGGRQGVEGAGRYRLQCKQNNRKTNSGKETQGARGAGASLRAAAGWQQLSVAGSALAGAASQAAALAGAASGAAALLAGLQVLLLLLTAGCAFPKKARKGAASESAHALTTAIKGYSSGMRMQLMQTIL